MNNVKFCPFDPHFSDCDSQCALYTTAVNGCSIRALAESLIQKGGVDNGKKSRTERVPQQE